MYCEHIASVYRQLSAERQQLQAEEEEADAHSLSFSKRIQKATAMACPLRRCQGKYGCKCTAEQKNTRARRLTQPVQTKFPKQTKWIEVSLNGMAPIVSKNADRIATDVAPHPGPSTSSKKVGERAVAAKEAACPLRRCQGKRGCICSPPQLASRARERAKSKILHQLQIAKKETLLAKQRANQEAAKAAKETARAAAEAARGSLPENMYRPKDMSSPPFVRLEQWSRHPTLEKVHSLLVSGSLRRDDIKEVAHFMVPPVAIALIANAVMFMLGLVRRNVFQEQMGKPVVDAWQPFKKFLKKEKRIINLLLRYDPARALRPKQVVFLHKYLQNDELTMKRVARVSVLGVVLVKWMRAVISQWQWCKSDLCRTWARVMLAGKRTTTTLTLGSEITPETKALMEWFSDYPGCCRLVGGIILGYACDTARYDLSEFPIR